MKSIFSVVLTLISLVANSQTYSEILCRPAANSMSVSLLFDQTMEVYIEYGLNSGTYPYQTGTYTLSPAIPFTIELQELLPNTRYYYKTRYRLPGVTGFSTSSEHSFITQRAPGSSFTFTVETDVHLYDKKGCVNLYKISLANEAADQPDFMIDMGDTYGDDRNIETFTDSISHALHKFYRPLLGQVCHSIPYLFCLGNHEGEFDYYLNQNPPDNIAVWGTTWRKFYFPNPVPNDFYSGNSESEGYGMGLPENYYAYTWGDALFVILDAYRYQSVSDTSAKPQKWDWTLGQTQYEWFKSALEGSNAKYKFVFIHQLCGQGRGGILDAPYYEWGGMDGNGNWQFDTRRPGWYKPIHQLMVENGVNVLFHGHDHLFSHEVLDGLVYQEVPMPSDSSYTIGMLANADAYSSDTLEGSGHIRVQVSADCVQVDFVRAYLPQDTLSGLHHNREVPFSYKIGGCALSDENTYTNPLKAKIYPNPASTRITIENPDSPLAGLVDIFALTGELVLSNEINSNRMEIDISSLSPGIYLLKYSGKEGVINQSFVKE